MVRTGEDGCINNIYGFAGNVKELTQEQLDRTNYAIRGGSYNNQLFSSVDHRHIGYYRSAYKDTGFRATLYIK